MIDYDPGTWSIMFACSLKGSVFPRSFAMAVPCSSLAMLLHFALHSFPDFAALVGAGDVGTSVLSGFSFVLGFLVVFRSQQAYARWWEGGTLLQELRGEWFNAFSSLLAFCSTDEKKAQDVQKFQHLLVRLMSLLYGSALQQVATVRDKDFELIDPDGIDPECLAFLQNSHDACEVVLQWIQRLIVSNHANGAIDIAPPILSRVYNQLGNGIVNLNNARKITDFPIPFPLAQMITIMLIVHWFTTLIVCASSVSETMWAGALSFVIIMSFWSINFIAVELEMPFGDDLNDLPIYDMQRDLNASLIGLMHHQAQSVPAFHYDKDIHSHLAVRDLDFRCRLDTQVSKKPGCPHSKPAGHHVHPPGHHRQRASGFSRGDIVDKDNGWTKMKHQPWARTNSVERPFPYISGDSEQGMDLGPRSSLDTNGFNQDESITQGAQETIDTGDVMIVAEMKAEDDPVVSQERAEPDDPFPIVQRGQVETMQHVNTEHVLSWFESKPIPGSDADVDIGPPRTSDRDTQPRPPERVLVEAGSHQRACPEFWQEFRDPTSSSASASDADAATTCGRGNDLRDAIQSSRRGRVQSSRLRTRPRLASPATSHG